MAALDFPTSPSVGDTYTANGGTWRWDGTAWVGGNTLTVPYGGTGATTLTGVVKGNGTSAFTAGTVSLTTEVSNTLPVGSGGTGAVTLTGYVKGSGTSALTASASIPVADVTGALSTTTAASTYQTISGMSSYLTTSTASTTYAPLASPTFTGTVTTATVDQLGSVRGNVTAVSALDIDCSAGNYFTKTISADSTFTFSNAPSSRAYAFTLELTHTSGTVTWPTSVKWPGDTAPSLTTGKTHLFVFVTDDGGTRWRGVAQKDYVN